MEKKLKTLKNLNQKRLKNKHVLLRVDFNVVVEGKKIKENYRIKTTLPTIKYLLKNKAKIILISHFGRPEGKKDKKYSLKIIAEYLSKILKKKVFFCSAEITYFLKDEIERLFKKADVVMLENLRFYPEEEKNDKDFSKKLASLADLYVNEAFAASHRSHASVYGVAKLLPSYAGFLFEKEIYVLSRVFLKPLHPLTIIIGGAKIETKTLLIKRFWKIADHILLGGAIANTILFAKGLSIGKSKIEKEVLDQIFDLNILNPKIHLPVDALTAENPESQNFFLHSIGGDLNGRMILDIGPDTIEIYKKIIEESKMIIWNGPMGYFENKLFRNGSNQIVRAILKSKAFSVIGGGETVSLMSNVNHQMSNVFLSTGGGAMLEFLSAKKLPGVEVLKIACRN